MSERRARSIRTDYTVLGCLSLGAESGYDIKQLIDRAISHFWRESYGQIYPSLRRLEQEGLVVEVPGAARGARRRRSYRLTSAGLEELREWLAEPAKADVVRYETSLKLFFGAQMTVDDAVAHVRRYRQRQLELLDQYRDAAGRLEEGESSSPRLAYWSVVLDGGLRYSEMAVAWCDATVDRLSRLRRDAYPADPAG